MPSVLSKSAMSHIDDHRDVFSPSKKPVMSTLAKPIPVVASFNNHNDDMLSEEEIEVKPVAPKSKLTKLSALAPVVSQV